MYSVEQYDFLVFEHCRLNLILSITRRSFQSQLNVADKKTISQLFDKFQSKRKVDDDTNESAAYFINTILRLHHTFPAQIVTNFKTIVSEFYSFRNKDITCFLHLPLLLSELFNLKNSESFFSTPCSFLFNFIQFGIEI